jgi:hypothetical protein
MSKPKRIGEILAEMAMNPTDELGRIFRKCPCVQVELVRQKHLSLNELTDDEIDKLGHHAFLEDWIDAQDVMHYLHISPRTLQTLRTNGTLPFSRIGNKIYYLRQDVERILRDNYTMYKIRNYGTDK